MTEDAFIRGVRRRDAGVQPILLQHSFSESRLHERLRPPAREPEAVAHRGEGPHRRELHQLLRVVVEAKAVEIDDEWSFRISRLFISLTSEYANRRLDGDGCGDIARDWRGVRRRESGYEERDRQGEAHVRLSSMRRGMRERARWWFFSFVQTRAREKY